MRTVIIQRVVPHYRAPLFDQLHAEFGWTVATGADGGAHGFSAAGDAPWLHRFAFGRDQRSQYRATVPVDAILQALTPEAVVAEFSPQMSSTWRLSLDATLRRAPRRPLAYWSQGPNVERGFRRPADLAAQALRLALMAPADAQLCYGEEGAAYLRRRLPGRAPVFVATNTVDVEAYPGRDQDNSPGDPSCASLLFVGRVTPDKRVPLLVSALRLVRERRPGVTLTVVGDGPDLPAAQEAARGLEGAVTFTGAVYGDAALAPFFQQASLFVYAGSIGLAANHALAYGVPVAMFDDPGQGAHHHPEHAYVVPGVTGWRFPGSDAPAFAQGLLDPLDLGGGPRAALGASVREYVSRRLTIAAMVDGFRALDRFLETRR